MPSRLRRHPSETEGKFAVSNDEAPEFEISAATPEWNPDDELTAAKEKIGCSKRTAGSRDKRSRAPAYHAGRELKKEAEQVDHPTVLVISDDVEFSRSITRALAGGAQCACVHDAERRSVAAQRR